MKLLILDEAVHQEVDVPDDPEPVAYEEKPHKKKYEVVMKMNFWLFIETQASNWILYEVFRCTIVGFKKVLIHILRIKTYKFLLEYNL